MSLDLDWCPGCDPEAPDAIRRPTVVCWRHQPDQRGSADPVAPLDPPLGQHDIDGVTNKRWCDALHRGLWPLVLVVLVLAGCSLDRLRCEGPSNGVWRDGQCHRSP